MDEINQNRRVYQNFLLDSTRWDHVQERDGDIIIATPYKSGTTWMQNIVLHLIFQNLEPRILGNISIWVDNRLRPIEKLVNTLETQDHRRCMKSHLPRDGLKLRANSQYIVVGRDPRDVFMSFWNHYSSYTTEFIAEMNDTPGRVGPPLMPCPDDIRELWAMWTTKGWFDWESEGYPHWSNFRHVQTWWEARVQPNILFVHFNDLLVDLKGEIARISDYLDIETSPDMLTAITDAVTFKSMRRDSEILLPKAEKGFLGGAKTFINKGTNGRWKGVLTEGDLALYHDVVSRELTQDCQHWLENGRLADIG